jgi:hypothetical protein
MITTEELLAIHDTLEWAAARAGAPLSGQIPRQLGAVAREIERRKDLRNAIAADALAAAHRARTDFHTRERECEVCGGEGRELRGHPNDPHPKDIGPCPACDGTGRVTLDLQAETQRDHDDAVRDKDWTVQ